MTRTPAILLLTGLMLVAGTRPAHADVTAFFGRGAITDSMIEPGGEAPQPRPAQGDHATAMALVAGILAALRVAERTGVGQVVDASLLGMATWTMATDLAPVLVDGRQPSRRDRHHLIAALANRFPCADGRWIVLNMPETHWWPKFCRTVDREALEVPEGIAQVLAAMAFRDRAVELLDPVLERLPSVRVERREDLIQLGGVLDLGVGEPAAVVQQAGALVAGR